MARRRTGLRIDGWLVVDKPRGMTSVQVVGRVRRATRAARLGHGGTLDPEATGILPVALGEATKTIAWCHDAEKTYRARVRWGEATDTDDVEGRVIGTSPVRPDADAVRAALSGFVGTISQVPPAFSAVKVGGRRAYDLARRNLAPELEARDVTIRSLSLVGTPDRDHADLEIVCGKGTYIRSLARDLARRLGTLGHVAALRRTRVGPFAESVAISVDKLDGCDMNASALGALLSVETALDDIPALAVTDSMAELLRHGQAVEAPGTGDGIVRVRTVRGLVAIGRIECGSLRPVRVFNLVNERGHDVDHG